MITLVAAKKRWRTVSGGAGFLRKTVDALAILTIIRAALNLPLSVWLSKALHAYIAIFHPLVDHTIGLIPAIFGLHLVPWAKDLVVLYVAIGSALGRVGYANIKRYELDAEPFTLKGIAATLYVVLVWPIILRSQIRIANRAKRASERAEARGLSLADYMEETLLRAKVRMSARHFDQLLNDYEIALVNTREFKKELGTVAAIVVAVVMLNALGKF